MHNGRNEIRQEGYLSAFEQRVRDPCGQQIVPDKRAPTYQNAAGLAEGENPFRLIVGIMVTCRLEVTPNEWTF